MIFSLSLSASLIDRAEVMGQWIIGTLEPKIPLLNDRVLEFRYATRIVGFDPRVLDLLTNTKPVEAEALSDFLNAMKSGDSREILKFFEVHGAMDGEYVARPERRFTLPRGFNDEGYDPPKNVKERLKAIQGVHKPVAISLVAAKELANQLEKLLELVDALNQRDVDTLRREMSDAPKNLDLLETARLRLITEIYSGLNEFTAMRGDSTGDTSPFKGAAVTLDFEKGQPVAVVQATTLRGALFCLLLKALTGQTKYGVCENPKCVTKHFVVTQHAKKFCSERCQNYTKVQRYRDKKEKK